MNFDVVYCTFINEGVVLLPDTILGPVKSYVDMVYKDIFLKKALKSPKVINEIAKTYNKSIVIDLTGTRYENLGFKDKKITIPFAFFYDKNQGSFYSPSEKSINLNISEPYRNMINDSINHEVIHALQGASRLPIFLAKPKLRSKEHDVRGYKIKDGSRRIAHAKREIEYKTDTATITNDLLVYYSEMFLDKKSRPTRNTILHNFVKPVEGDYFYNYYYRGNYGRGKMLLFQIMKVNPDKYKQSIKEIGNIFINTPDKDIPNIIRSTPEELKNKKQYKEYDPNDERLFSQKYQKIKLEREVPLTEEDFKKTRYIVFDQIDTFPKLDFSDRIETMVHLTRAIKKIPNYLKYLELDNVYKGVLHDHAQGFGILDDYNFFKELYKNLKAASDENNKKLLALPTNIRSYRLEKRYDAKAWTGVKKTLENEFNKKVTLALFKGK